MSSELKVSQTGQVPLDLSASNSLQAMLAERCQLAEAARSAQQRIAAIDNVIRILLGSAESAVAGDFEIRNRLCHRRECTIPAGDYRRLLIKRTDEEVT